MTAPSAPRHWGRGRRPILGRLDWDRFGLSVMLGLGALFGIGYMFLGLVPVDMPWTANLDRLYSETWGIDAGSKYVYPPTVAQVIAVLHEIGQLAAVLLWTMALWACAWIAYRQWSIPVVLAAIPALVVTGWPLLNPVLFRREWRNLGVALGVTAGIALVSFALAPNAWADFASFAQRNAGTPSPVPVVPVPFALRAAMSVALLAWGAPRDKRWTVPLAVGWSAIALYEWSFLTIWAAALPMLRRDRSSEGEHE